MTADDESDYIGLVSHPEVMKYMVAEPLDEMTAKIRFQKAINLNAEYENLGINSVLDKESGAYIGLSKLTPIQEGIAEPGYAIFPEHWRKGIATEIIQSLIQRAKELGNLVVLEAYVDPMNAASRKVLEKCGFKFHDQRKREGLLFAVYRLEI